MYRTFRFTSADGTSLLGWTNDGEGPTVLVLNGLAVPPEAWPRLLDPNCGYNVIGYNHRGTFGSDKPDDIERIRIDDHVDDAFALLDELGIDSALLIAWSYGVNISFEIARRDPARVAGMVMICGVPGGTFHSAFAPLMIPRPLRRPLSLGVAKLGEFLAPPINAVAKALPRHRVVAEMLRQSRIIMPTATNEDVLFWLDAFAKGDFKWYFQMFPPAGEHERIETDFLKCPITVAAGSFDPLTSMLDVVAFAEQIEHAKIHVLLGTHFLPLEYPDQIMEMLNDVAAQSGVVDLTDSADLAEVSGR